MQPENPASIVCEFALRHAPAAPLPERSRLYRAIALIAGDEKRAIEMNALAQELDDIEARHQQLLLNFRQRSESDGNGEKA
jgi:hypothetical protein